MVIIGTIHRAAILALSTVGSAILLCGCGGQEAVQDENPEALMTQHADSVVSIQSQNGGKKYRMQTPLVEGYELARDPYREFPRGIDIVTFDSTGRAESTLVADYAIEFVNQQLWEAKGNVVATNAKGHRLETQQLFWNRKTGKIYSNIDSKITQGDDVIIGVGFESDDKFDVWEFRRPRGHVTVDTDPTQSGTDSTATIRADSVSAGADAGAVVGAGADAEAVVGAGADAGVVLGAGAVVGAVNVAPIAKSSPTTGMTSVARIPATTQSTPVAKIPATTQATLSKSTPSQSTPSQAKPTIGMTSVAKTSPTTRATATRITLAAVADRIMTAETDIIMLVRTDRIRTD